MGLRPTSTYNCHERGPGCWIGSIGTHSQLHLRRTTCDLLTARTCLVHCAPLVSQVGGGPAAGRGKDRMLTLHTEPLPAPLGDEEFAASLAETNGLLSSPPPPPNLQRDERLAAQLAAELVEVDNMAPEVRLTRIRTSLVHATTPCCAQR